MDNKKKYFWLRLHRDFFKRHDIQIVEGMQNGKDYILFYLKLLVESIDHEGMLRFSDTIPYSEEMLSVLTHTNIDIVKSALDTFTKLGMITILDDSTIFMEGVQKLIGEAERDEHTRESDRLRQRRCREKKKLALLSCDSNVTCHGEIEKEIEIEKDINNMSTSIDSIIKYLNEVCGSHYQLGTPKTRTLIKNRLKEGFTVNDFKTVISKKHREWKDNPQMQQYLRPETLFGTKFEAYLNQKEVKPQAKNTFNQMMERDYNFDDLEKGLLDG